MANGPGIKGSVGLMRWGRWHQGAKGFECQVKECVDFVTVVSKLYSLEPWGSVELPQALHGILSSFCDHRFSRRLLHA